jgi:peroxiredoxin
LTRRKPPPRSRYLGWAAQAALLVAVVLGVSAWQTRKHLSNGTPAPSFALRKLGGGEVRLADLRGKRVLVHFWATWCGVCKLEPGALNAVQDDLEPDEVLLSIVANSEDQEEILRFVKEHDIRYPVLLADDSVVRAYRVGAFPTNYFIAPDGTISASSVGLTTRFALGARMGCAR